MTADLRTDLAAATQRAADALADVARLLCSDVGEPSPVVRGPLDAFDRTGPAGQTAWDRLGTDATEGPWDRLARLLAAHRAGVPIVVVSGVSWATELAEKVGLSAGEWQPLDEERTPLTADELVLVTEAHAEVPDVFRGRVVHHVTVQA